MSVQQFIDAGYTSVSAAAAVEADDLGLLVHPGRYQVQLPPPAEVDGEDGDNRSGS